MLNPDDSSFTFSGTEFSDVLQAHALWVETEGREGKRAHLRGMDLRNVSLKAVVLAEANLRGADLSGADLTGADLRGADLAEADVRRALLRQTKLSGTVFARALLCEATIDQTECVSADFSGADMRQVKIAQVNGFGANFREVNFQGATITDATFTEANYRSSHLENALLSRVDFTHSDFRGARLDNASLKDCTLYQSQFRDACLEGVDLSGSDFTSAIEVSPEYYIHYITCARSAVANEREAVEAQKIQLSKDQLAVEARAKSIEEEGRRLASVRISAGALSKKSSAAKGWFAASTGVWLFLSLVMAFLIVVALGTVPVNKLRMEEIILVAAMIGMPFILFATSFLCASQLKEAIRHFKETL